MKPILVGNCLDGLRCNLNSDMDAVMLHPFRSFSVVIVGPIAVDGAAPRRSCFYDRCERKLIWGENVFPSRRMLHRCDCICPQIASPESRTHHVVCNWI